MTPQAALKNIYIDAPKEVITFFRIIEIRTDQNNLLKLDPMLKGHVNEDDFFHLTDLTNQVYEWVDESRIQEGTITVQSLHTTCLVANNELDEPCLVGDISRHLNQAIPRNKTYLHNSSLRTKNLCESDTKCDRNADSHMKTFLFGSPTQTVIVHQGKPLLGEWQKICFIDLDGPRTRKVAVQIVGTC